MHRDRHQILQTFSYMPPITGRLTWTLHFQRAACKSDMTWVQQRSPWSLVILVPPHDTYISPRRLVDLMLLKTTTAFMCPPIHKGRCVGVLYALDQRTGVGSAHQCCQGNKVACEHVDGRAYWLLNHLSAFIWAIPLSKHYWHCLTVTCFFK